MVADAPVNGAVIYWGRNEEFGLGHGHPGLKAFSARSRPRSLCLMYFGAMCTPKVSDARLTLCRPPLACVNEMTLILLMILLEFYFFDICLFCSHFFSGIFITSSSTCLCYFMLYVPFVAIFPLLTLKLLKRIFFFLSFMHMVQN